MSELARFLFQRSHYSPTNGALKPGAFLPKDGHTSVFDIIELDRTTIRTIGDGVGVTRSQALHGWGEFLHAHVTAAGLKFIRDDQPPRHGNLVGWPPDGPEHKAQAKAIAVALARKAELVLVDAA